jgi:hypothetical protein
LFCHFKPFLKFEPKIQEKLITAEVLKRLFQSHVIKLPAGLSTLNFVAPKYSRFAFYPSIFTIHTSSHGSMKCLRNQREKK